MWKDAVVSLNKAIKLKPDLALPRASLGVAYLVKPDGKDARIASKHFQAALDLADKDPELKKNRQAMAALLVNAAVGDLAHGDKIETDLKLKQALKLADLTPLSPLVKSLEEAIIYNAALLDVASGDAERKAAACKKLELYLSRACPDAAWWTLAYERYEKLAEEGKIWSKKIRAATLWKKMLSALFETGHPWITFKDPPNIRSPQDHCGVIHN